MKSGWIGAVAGALLVTLVVLPAGAQMSGVSPTNSSSANELVNGIFDNPTYERESGIQVPIPSGATISTRYFGLASADCGIACGSKTETLNSNYTIAWNVTAPATVIYQLTIATQRRAGLTCVDEDTGNCVSSMGGLACTPSGGTLVSGACTLADPADNNTSGTSDVNVNQSNSMVRCAAGDQSFSMNYVWTQSALTPGTGFISVNSDESAVRLGGTSDDTTETAADYPGVGMRSQANDGHFMQVTYTSLCGNGVINSCGSTTEQCDEGVANGTPTSCCTASCALKSIGTVCRGAAGGCDVAEVCDGASGVCPADGFVGAGIECRGVSVGEVCDEAEECTGTGPACPPDGVQPFGTLCRGLQGECDVIENCDGVSKLCPADAKVPNGTACSSDGNVCTVDQCNGTSNLCQHPAGNAGTTCRASAGVCDIAETCTGSSPTCPANAFLNFLTNCRPISDVCDLQENCPGNGPDCAPDTFRPAGANCPDDGNPCTLDQCNGASAACQHPAGHAGLICRLDTGACDVAEFCDGSNTNCPADGFEPSGTTCTSDGETCTLDICDGNNNCTHPAGNGGVTCRAVTAGEDCDLAEQCDGSNPTCPADLVKISGTSCTADSEVCTLDQCNGSSKLCQHPAGNAGTQCRADAGECDVAESCNGILATCPPNLFELPGTACGSPANTDCDNPDACNASGTCLANNEVNGLPCDDGLACTAPDECTAGVCIGDVGPCPLDHYKCYQGKDLKNPKFTKVTVNTTDQIITNQPAEVKKLKFVCTPVDKDGEGIFNPNAHLACYQVKAQNLSPRPNVEVVSQFQTSRFSLKKGKLICLPATKTTLP